MMESDEYVMQHFQSRKPKFQPNLSFLTSELKCEDLMSKIPRYNEVKSTSALSSDFTLELMEANEKVKQSLEKTKENLKNCLSALEESFCLRRYLIQTIVLELKHISIFTAGAAQDRLLTLSANLEDLNLDLFNDIEKVKKNQVS